MMTKKRQLTTTVSIRNYNKMEEAIKNNLLCGSYLTKTAIVDLALDLFFMELEENGIEQLALKTIQYKEQTN